MRIEPKPCLSCSKPVKGRTDKKFCDDYCRNSYHNRYPKEVCLAIQLRGALMRKINRLTQEATP